MNKYLFLLTLSIALLSCKKQSQLPGLSYKTININGTQRRYAIYIPQNFHDNMPVVFSLHGGGVTIEQMTGDAGNKSPYKLWMQLADKEGFIVVYPQATNGSTGKPNWNDCRADCQICPNTDDQNFLLALIDTLIMNYSIDTNRIYFTGTSNGGFMTLRMAACAPNKIAAIGVIIASQPDTSKCSCQLNTPMPAIFINGTDDPLLPYNGGILGNPPDPTHGSAMAVEKNIHYWVQLNHCDTLPLIDTLPDIDTKDGCIVVKYFYKSSIGCDVEFYKVIGGGHTAPSIDQQYSWLWLSYVGKQDHDMETVEVLWNFLKNYELSSRSF